MAPAKKKKSSSSKKIRSAHPPKAFPRKRQGPVSALAPAVVAGPSAASLFFLAGLVLVVAGMMTLPNFHLLLPPEGFLAHSLVNLPWLPAWLPWSLVAGLGGLVYAFVQMPPVPSRGEMPKWQAYPLFAFFFGLCFFWRFYRPQEPSAPFWFDNQVVTGDIANIVDTHQNYLLFPWGQREAFFPYFTAGLWEIFSKAGGVWIIRLSCTLIDMIALWALYLLGRTLGGRRMGLILMAFWSVSLPMTIWNYFGMGQNTAALAAILSLLFFFRMVEKPTLARFIYWGAALGFGGYCYVPFRPWPPAMITIGLLWVLFGTPERLKGIWAWFLGLGLWVSWAFLFFLKNSYLPEGNPLVVTFRAPWFLALWVLLLTVAFVKTAGEYRKNGIGNRLIGWSVGVVTMALLMAPLYLHPAYAQHTTASSVFTGDAGPLPLGQALQGIWHNINFFFAVMFGQPSEDVSRYPLPGQSYFEFFPEFCMVLGLASLAARPSWKKATVVLMALVGMTSLVFSNHPHTGRVESSVPPLLLLGAMGLNVFWDHFRAAVKDRFLPLAVLVLLAALWAWDADKTFLSIRGWMAEMSNDNVIGHQVEKDWKPYRVIISTHYPEFATPALTVLCDQKEAYVLSDPNPIYLEPGQTGKDIAFYMYGSSRYDQALENRVKTEFPQAQWNIIESTNREVPHLLLRAVIPLSALEEKPGKLFYIQRVPHDYWRRQFYWKDYGVGRGIVWWDERVPGLTAPFPPGMNEYMTARADGEIQTPQPGDYEFSVGPTNDVIVLSIDGKKVIEVRSTQGAPHGDKGKLFLKAGPHQVDYVTTFRRLTPFADIRVKSLADGKEWIIGLPTADAKP